MSLNAAYQVGMGHARGWCVALGGDGGDDDYGGGGGVGG